MAQVAEYEAYKAELDSRTPEYEAGKALMAQLDAAVAGGMALEDVLTMAGKTMADYEKGLADIELYESSKALLDSKTAAYEAGKIVLAEKKAEYEKGKATYAAGLAEYNAGKAELDKNAPVLAAAKTQLDAATKQLADGKAKLDQYEAGQAKLSAAEVQLAEGKATLEAAEKQLAEGKAKLEEFEAGEAQIQAGYETLDKNERIKAKVDAGMDYVAAGREVIDEQTVETTEELTGRAIQYGATAVIAILGIVASILGLGAAKMPSINKIKGGIILGLLTVVLAIAANAYGALNGYTGFPIQMAAIVGIGVFALLFFIAFNTYKNALLALLKE